MVTVNPVLKPEGEWIGSRQSNFTLKKRLPDGLLKPELSPMRPHSIGVYSASSSSARLRSPCQSKWRTILVFTVLACFVLIQDPAAEVFHNHSHSGAHTHCCPACHGGHLSAVRGASLAIPGPSTSEWHDVSNELTATFRLTDSSASSRAPPA